jgi:hypothetical protein
MIRTLALTMFWLAMCVGSHQVFADTSTTSTTTVITANESKTPQAPPGFEPISGRREAAERVDANALVGAAYTAIFILLIGYLSHLFRERKRTILSIKAIQAQISNAEKGK